MVSLYPSDEEPSSPCPPAKTRDPVMMSKTKTERFFFHIFSFLKISLIYFPATQVIKSCYSLEQATKCPFSTSTRGMSPVLHDASAFGHRLANRHPASGSIGLVSSPSSSMRLTGKSGSGTRDSGQQCPGIWMQRIFKKPG